MGKVCPRATGRHPMRRKKNCVLVALGVLCVFFLVQMTQYDDGYTPLRPLADGKSEAKRLLKYITLYHCQCNSTLQIGNRSHWPICMEKEIGLDLDIKDGKVAYSIGSEEDYLVERDLALNYSVEVVIINHNKIPSYYARRNMTKIVETTLVPNDAADFSRNLYGQQTINDVYRMLDHKHIDILRMGTTANLAQMWEILHFMIEDNFIIDTNMQQLHLAMYIDKLDEDYLYNWYRVLYELFYKQGMRLYHTSSADSLCLQVTMMESCIYYMSFVRNPGPKVFVLHPPADFGSSELEEERLLDHIMTIQTECKQQIIGGPNEQNLQFTTPGQPQWQVCSSGVYELFTKPCSVFRFRLGNDHSLEQKFIHEGCSVHTIEPVIIQATPLKKYKMHGHYPSKHKVSNGHISEVKIQDEVFHILSHNGPISLLEIDVPGHEWEILSQILDSGIIANVSQVVAWLQIADTVYGKHHTILRTHYSELKRLEAQGMDIFHSSPTSPPLSWEGGGLVGNNYFFKLGFIKKADYQPSR